VTSRPCLAVLIVEDDADIRRAVATALEREGFQVYEAENGADARARLQEIPRPSLVLADFMTPVAGGWDLIGALSPDDRLATLPVIVLTTRDAGDPAGFRRVKRPIDLNDLVKIVGALCQRRI
jgi:CheY-like chemotaxis protein